MFLKSKLSEVIRAEAETCFLEIMKINILMLLLFVMIINNFVLTKVAIIQNIKPNFGYVRFSCGWVGVLTISD